MSSATLAYPPRGRSRNVSAAAIAREASMTRQNAIAALSRPELGNSSEKGVYSRQDIHVEQPGNQHAVPDPRRPQLQQSIRPPPMTHAYSSPPTLPIPRQHKQPRVIPTSSFSSQSTRSPQPVSPLAKTSTHLRRPTRSPPNAVASSSQHILSASTPPLVSDSSSSEDDQVLAIRKRTLTRRQHLARAEAAFTSARDRSRKERIEALTARGIAEDAAVERERAAREEAERKLRRTTVCRTPVVSRTYATPPVKRTSSGDNDFTYAFPVSSSRSGMGLWNARAKHGTPRTRRALQELLEPTPNPQAVPFEDVRAAMEGELFPEHEPSPVRHSSPWTRARSRDSDTLFTENARQRAWAVLMAPPSESASKPIKRRPMRDGDPVPQDRDCAACAAAWAHSLSSLEPSLGLNHLALPTTPPLESPSLSPASSAVSSPIATPRSWLPLSLFSRVKSRAPPTPPSPPQALLPQPTAASEPVHHTCGRPQAQCFTSVDVNDTPLGTPAPPPPPPRSRPFSSIAAAKPVVEEMVVPAKRGSWLAPVNSLFASAARVHEAYVQATLLSLSTPEYTSHRRRRRSSSSSSYSRSYSPGDIFWPRGVGSAEVRAFKADTPRASAEPYVLRALDPIVRQPQPKHEILPQPEHERMGPAPAAFVSAAQAVGSGGPRARPVAHHAHMRASAILNARRIASGGPIPPGGVLLPERVVAVAWDVHASSAKRGSALKWGWRMVWSEDEE